MKQKIKDFFKELSASKKKEMYMPVYRVSDIFQDDEGTYLVQIQIINKSLAFKARPEDILAEDNLVDQFSPRDIRTLTYLGYLGINSPKYKILAKRLSENNDKVVFAVKKKGEDKIIVKTADEIMQEKEILENLHAKDAHVVGYTFATEYIIDEKRQKDSLNKK